MDKGTVPHLRAVRLDSLGLSSKEAFVLAQVDGKATLDEVADATGVPLENVIGIVQRLAQLGALECPSAAPVARVRTSGRYADVVRPVSERPPPVDGSKLLDHVPQRTSTNVYSMALQTGDAFLLSNVDGSFSVRDLAEIIGDDPVRVAVRLDTLARAGALELRAPSKRPSMQRTPVAPKTRSGRQSHAKLRATQAGERPSSKVKSAARPSKTFRGPRAAPARAPSRADHVAVPRRPVLDDVDVSPAPRAPATPQPLPPKDDQACDLDASTCAQIDAVLASQAKRTHYGVLDAPISSTAKEISRAYFAIAAKLHPDRYYGKRLGPYKKKLEQAFRTASEAYEVLRSPERRAEYDGYLRLRRRSGEMDAALVAAPPPPAPAPAPVPAPAPSAPRVSAPAPVPAPSAPRVSAPVPPPAPSAPVPSPSRPVIREKPASMRPASVAPLSPRIPAAPASAPAPPVSLLPPVATSSPRPPPPVADVLQPPVPNAKPKTSGRRLVADAKSASLLEEAQRALLQGDVAAAANLYRLALEFAEEPSVRAYAESGLTEARSLVADTYLKRALYEEKESRWSEAVLSYEKALDRRPDDPAICERLANALRQEGQDLQRAAALAELAVSRTPRSAAYKRTLGLIYADAGKRDKAIEQFEAAFALDPSDEATNRALGMLRKAR